MHEAKTLAGLSAYRFFLSRMMESFKGWDTGIRITSVDGPGVRTMKIVSHGNMGISLAAYAAKAGRTCYMLRPENVVSERLSYLNVCGSKAIPVVSKYGSMYGESLKTIQKHSVLFINCDNPFRIEGQKTLALKLAGIWADISLTGFWRL